MFHFCSVVKQLMKVMFISHYTNLSIQLVSGVSLTLKMQLSFKAAFEFPGIKVQFLLISVLCMPKSLQAGVVWCGM